MELFYCRECRGCFSEINDWHYHSCLDMQKSNVKELNQQIKELEAELAALKGEGK